MEVELMRTLFSAQRLYHFYNPTQSVLKPAMNRMLHVSKEEYFDAYDIEVKLGFKMRFQM